MSSHEHLWKKGFSKPNSTPVPNPFKIQRRRAKVLSPTLSPQEKLQLKQQADQISQLGYNSQKIPIQAPAPTAEASPIQSSAPGNCYDYGGRSRSDYRTAKKYATDASCCCLRSSRSRFSSSTRKTKTKRTGNDTRNSGTHWITCSRNRSDSNSRESRNKSRSIKRRAEG